MSEAKTESSGEQMKPGELAYREELTAWIRERVTHLQAKYEAASNDYIKCDIEGRVGELMSLVLMVDPGRTVHESELTKPTGAANE